MPLGRWCLGSSVPAQVECSWFLLQGSGFPTLKRDEIKFVQASIAKIRGELPMSEKDFNALKVLLLALFRRGKLVATEWLFLSFAVVPAYTPASPLQAKIVLERGKRRDVTALLLAIKGQQLLDPDQYDELKEEMQKLGIDVGIKGAACTLSQTPEELSMDMQVLRCSVRLLSSSFCLPSLVNLLVS